MGNFELLRPRLKLAHRPIAIKGNHKVVKVAIIAKSYRLAFKYARYLKGAKRVFERI